MIKTRTVVQRAMDATIRYHERRTNQTWDQLMRPWRRAAQEVPHDRP